MTDEHRHSKRAVELRYDSLMRVPGDESSIAEPCVKNSITLCTVNVEIGVSPSTKIYKSFEIGPLNDIGASIIIAYLRACNSHLS